jgi:hypothetical protein
MPRGNGMGPQGQGPLTGKKKWEIVLKVQMLIQNLV